MSKSGNFVADEPFRAFAPVTTSDVTTYGVSGATNPRPIEALYVGTGGALNLTVIGQDGISATFFNVPSATTLFISPLKIMATGTGVSNILALYR